MILVMMAIPMGTMWRQYQVAPLTQTMLPSKNISTHLNYLGFWTKSNFNFWTSWISRSTFTSVNEPFNWSLQPTWRVTTHSLPKWSKSFSTTSLLMRSKSWSGSLRVKKPPMKKAAISIWRNSRISRSSWTYSCIRLIFLSNVGHLKLLRSGLTYYSTNSSTKVILKGSKIYLLACYVIGRQSMLLNLSLDL